jgi:hypothetical protein
MRRLLAAASLLVCATAWGQGADLAIDALEVILGSGLPALGRAHAGDTLYVHVRFRNHGPEPALNVAVDLSLPGTAQRYPFGVPEFPCEGTSPIHCTVGTLSGNIGSNYRFVSHRVTFPQSAGIYRVAATIYSTTPDPQPANNTRELFLDLSEAPDLNVSILGTPLRIAPEGQAQIRVLASNAGLMVAHHARLTIVGTGDAAIVDVKALRDSAACEIDRGQATCTREVLDERDLIDLQVTIAAPDRLSGGMIGVRAEATADETDFDTANNVAETSSVLIREMRVTNTNDSGEGSLRQALLDVTAFCTSEPCRIAFRIPPPVPESGWFTIAPESPLPRLTGNIVDISGGTQARFTGDTNLAGPEIEIRGDRLTEGDGITFANVCEAGLRSVAINGFPGNGVAIAADASLAPCVRGFQSGLVNIANSIIGLDPTGTTPIPNLRGIVTSAPSFVIINASVIGGNRRSAIFLSQSSFEITKNRIVGNGASGIFVSSTQFGGDILDNVIADNRDFGIARAFDAADVGMHGNLIYGNGHTAIDAGLDLETPNVPDDSRTIPNRPVLLSASYDAAIDVTTVRGHLDSLPEPFYPTSFAIEFFSSSSLSASGHGQAERFLGSLRPRSGRADFEFVSKGNLSNQWITATSSRSHIIGFAKPGDVISLGHRFHVPDDTSELSDPIQVTP